MATGKHATLCLHNIAPYSFSRPVVRKAVLNIQITVAPLIWTELFLWSAPESCLVIKPDRHICTDYIARFRFLREKFEIWCMIYVICTCLYVHTHHVMRNVTISSTMGTLCYELTYCTIHNKYFIHTVPCVLSLGMHGTK